VIVLKRMKRLIAALVLVFAVALPTGPVDAQVQAEPCTYARAIAGCRRQVVFVEELPASLPWYDGTFKAADTEFHVRCAQFSTHQTLCVLGSPVNDFGFGVVKPGPANPCGTGYLVESAGSFRCSDQPVAAVRVPVPAFTG
jgi:hypothetical protein